MDFRSPLPFVVHYRPLDPSSDIPRLSELHDLCFPVKYDDRFYQWLKTSRCIGLVAVIRESPMSDLCSSDIQPHEATAAGTDYAVGFVIGKLKYAEGPLLTKPVLYISTFGVDPEYRQHGIGHELLERFVAMICDPAFVTTHPALQEDRCYTTTWQLIFSRISRPRPISQIWLHCLADDQDVVKFYMKRRFVVVERISEYYEFNNALHDSLMMCREELPAADVKSGRVVEKLQEGARHNQGPVRAVGGRTLWDWLAGTCMSDTLQAQDDLTLDDELTQRGIPRGRNISRAFVMMLVFGIVIASAGGIAVGLSLLQGSTHSAVPHK